jgi:hypothetical protein
MASKSLRQLEEQTLTVAAPIEPLYIMVMSVSGQPLSSSIAQPYMTGRC